MVDDVVPHPQDCTKYYSCQTVGDKGYKAQLMECPLNTGFDMMLRICNDEALSSPWCIKGTKITFNLGN